MSAVNNVDTRGYTIAGRVPGLAGGTFGGNVPNRRRYSKYHAIRTVLDGYNFDSKGEAARYQELKLLEKAGEISDLAIHPRMPIVINGCHVCFVVLDFGYVRKADGQPVWEDFKPGLYTSESKLRHKLFKAFYGQAVFLSKKGGVAR